MKNKNAISEGKKRQQRQKSIFGNYKIKAQRQNELLFYRKGDFYELYNEDAITVSSLLGITLTARGEIPMCCIPYRAIEHDRAELVKLGISSAICDQETGLYIREKEHI